MNRPYHHGALREALLAAAEVILEHDGVEALTLRATARKAGVSMARLPTTSVTCRACSASWRR